jgi:hypothetical protein
MGSIGESPPRQPEGEETSHVKHENPAIGSIRLFSIRVINFALRIATAYTKGFVLSKNRSESEKRKRDEKDELCTRHRSSDDWNYEFGGKIFAYLNHVNLISSNIPPSDIRSDLID